MSATGSVSIADDGTETKSGLAGRYYDAIYAVEYPLIPDPTVVPDDYPGTAEEWFTYINTALVKVKRVWARQANSLANGQGNGATGYAFRNSTATANGTYAEILSFTFTTVRTGSYILVNFSASGVQNVGAGTVFFQLKIDGVVQKGCYFSADAGYGFNMYMVFRAGAEGVGIAAGDHTVSLEWKTNTNTASIRPTIVNEEHCNLYAQEIG